MSNTKVISANGFNEYGGVSYTNLNGNSAAFSGVIINTSLPTDGDYEFSEEPSFATVEVAIGDQTVVAGVSGRQISVMSYTVVVDDDSTVQFLSSGTTVSDLSGPMSFAANGGATVNDNEVIFRTNIGDSLVVQNSSGNLGGHLAYRF